MKVNGKHYRTLWPKENDPSILQVIDQRHLPHQFIIEDLHCVEDTAKAIKEMHIRGAGLIGAVAAYGMYQGSLTIKDFNLAVKHLEKIALLLKKTRPTAVNLEWAVNRQLVAIQNTSDLTSLQNILFKTAMNIADEDAHFCKQIGVHGLDIIQKISKQKNGDTVNILTHCNAGWLAFVDSGTATAPIYEAHAKGIPLHVWVDETRPRNQGARLTAWELKEQGIPHTVIADNTGGHLMQNNLVDMVIVGSDRTTRSGDVANKIGTYLKSLAAKDNNIPFYVALPSSSIDWTISDGLSEISIEQRGAEEVTNIQGLLEGKIVKIQLTPKESPAKNYGFDITPARLVTSLITERGVCLASEAEMIRLFPEFQ